MEAAASRDLWQERFDAFLQKVPVTRDTSFAECLVQQLLTYVVDDFGTHGEPVFCLMGRSARSVLKVPFVALDASQDCFETLTGLRDVSMRLALSGEGRHCILLPLCLSREAQRNMCAHSFPLYVNQRMTNSGHAHMPHGWFLSCFCISPRCVWMSGTLLRAAWCSHMCVQHTFC